MIKSTRVFETGTVTGSELFVLTQPYSHCYHFFIRDEFSIKIQDSFRFKLAKSSLPVAVRIGQRYATFKIPDKRDDDLPCHHLHDVLWRTSSAFVACMFVLFYAFVQSLGRGIRKKKVCNCRQFRRRERKN